MSTRLLQNKTNSSDAPGTRERIIHAALTLFGERGVDAVSLREITSAAGVNSAALHYHFGSKEALLVELFQSRALPVTQRRIELLSKVRREEGRPILEDVLRAFLQPALEVGAGDHGAAFVRLRAWLALAPAPFRNELLGKAFDESTRMFLAALAQALPDLPAKDLSWRFHFLLGAMVYTTVSPGRIESVTQGALSTSDSTEAVEELVTFAAAGFRGRAATLRTRSRSRRAQVKS